MAPSGGNYCIKTQYGLDRQRRSLGIMGSYCPVDAAPVQLVNVLWNKNVRLRCNWVAMPTGAGYGAA